EDIIDYNLMVGPYPPEGIHNNVSGMDSFQ
ncbi:MAG: hypothetical protein K0R02_1087, partial [Rickettsiaceae bacterium]|nr:hypothetical protein [Rickettsiaceae bacterium]